MRESASSSPGCRFKQALKQERPLQVMGVINAYAALMAEQVGYRALYLSGAGVANACFGLPDLGMTTMQDVAEEARRITSVTSLPLLVDIDTGWGHAFSIARAIKLMIQSGVAAVHIEDQVQAKRCGHRPRKAIVPTQEMVDRIKACVDARTDKDFVIMARTDAVAVEGMQAAIARAHAYVEAGADMIFPEALPDLASYRQFTQAIHAPVLANMTEFGQTPLLNTEELAEAGVAIALYPLSAWRAMNKAALTVYETIRKQGSQKAVLADMQTRDELYHYLKYHQYEQKLDSLSD